MSFSNQSSTEEIIKKYLIVGETLDGIHSFQVIGVNNLIIFVVLLGSAIYSFTEVIVFGSFWYLLAFGFTFGMFYYLLTLRVSITYAITNYRIIRIESNTLTNLFFGSSRLLGYTDLHYEHVESISVGGTSINPTRFYLSLFLISTGWILLDIDALQTLDVDFFNLIAVLTIITGLINVLSSLPITGVQLILQSVSGETMKFPESKTPPQFVDDLILNCRTFLSYGAK